MDHVKRIGGEFPRQAAEQRDELHLARRRLRQLLDHGGERTAVADADDFVLAAFKRLAQEACAFQRQSLQRKSAFAEVGRHFLENGFDVAIAGFLLENATDTIKQSERDRAVCRG